MKRKNLLLVFKRTFLIQLILLIVMSTNVWAQETPNNQTCDYSFESGNEVNWGLTGPNTTFNFETANPYDGATYLSADVSTVSGWSEYFENENCISVDVVEGNVYEYSFAYRTPSATADSWVRVIKESQH